MKYFDYAATTAINPEVLDTYIYVSENFYAHPDTYQPSIQLREESKKVILDYLGLSGYKLTYTSGGTEANNMAIIGSANSFTTKKHFITSSYEHSSVYETFKFLEKEGHKVDFIDADKNGIVNAEDVIKKINKDTVLVSIMSVNNELGTVNDIANIAKMVKKHDEKILFMTDHVQGLGKVFDIDFTNVDMITISAHKIYGPKGIGCVIRKANVNLVKIIHGGVNENGLRGGTQNLSNEVAFAKAVKIIFENKKNILEKINQNMTYLKDALEEIPEVKLNLDNVETNILNIAILIDMQSESFVKLLSEQDIKISNKSACAKPNEINRSLRVLGCDAYTGNRSYRISISHNTNQDDLEYLVDKIKVLIEQVKGNK